jgi:DNA repair exonuclease SbcCD ATPase subunit
MDFDQIQKRLQWVEDDRRKEKDSVLMLENRLLAFEGGLSAVTAQIKEMSGEVTRLSTLVSRMDQYDQNALQIRIETKRMLEELQKDLSARSDEIERASRLEVKSLDNSFIEMRRSLEILPKLEKGIQARIAEENTIRRMIDELEEKIKELGHDEDEYTRTFRVLEDGRRQDSKKIVDLQGEVTALRKRVDDQRGQTELSSNSLRKLESRLNELATVEAERREAISSFLDRQALLQVERDRVWKEWQTRFETIEKQAAEVETQLGMLDTTHREAKRAQSTLEELAQKVERRINELTEIQRLSEDRFRQEWATFKADDQKRWTNYTLTQEENRNETIRQFEKLAGQATQLEDDLQDVKDLLQQANEQAEKRLQSLLAMAHDWVAAYERSIGRSR